MSKVLLLKMNVRDENVEDLNYEQRLKSAVHYTVVRICREVEDKQGMPISKQVMAAIAETAWRQFETYANDLEMFARHAKRSTVLPEDVKLLVRKSPALLDHINKEHRHLQAGRDEPRRRGPKGGKKKSVAASDTLEETDENANVTD